MGERWANAVFDRGGVKGIGMVGAVAAFERAGYRFAGTAGMSAGAIVAALLAAGYSAAELREVLLDLDFAALADRRGIGRVPVVGPAVRLWTRLGVCAGDRFLALMRELLAAKGVRTFADLRLPPDLVEGSTPYRARVVAADLTRGAPLTLPEGIRAYGIAPDELEVALAVRMSMGIPLFFEPVRLATPAGDSLFADPGHLSPFPLGLFDLTEGASRPTFGFRMVRQRTTTDPRREIRSPLALLWALYATAVEATGAELVGAHDAARTVAVDSLDVRAIDFRLSRERKEALYAAGVAAGEAFLRRRARVGSPHGPVARA